MEDKFEQLFELEEETLTESITVTINKRIMKIIGKYVLVILCIFIIIFSVWGITYTYNKSRYYNPLKQEKAAEMFDQRKSNIRQDITFESLTKEQKEYEYLKYYDYLMATYYSIFLPGKYYGGTQYSGYNSIEYENPGSYYLTGSINNGFGNTLEYYDKYYSISQSWNSSDVFSYTFVFSAQEEDQDVGYEYIGKNWHEKTKEDMRAEVASMPDSSIFMAFVSLENKIPLQNWERGQIKDYEYKYILTDFVGQTDYMGFTIDDYTGGSYGISKEDMQGHYWAVYDSYTSEDYYEYYKTRLTILKEHPDFTSTFNSEEVNRLEVINMMLENIENKEVYVKGYLVHVTKQQLLEIIDDSNTSYVHIEDVIYSKYEK